jgi:hypothetical protein
MGLDSLFCSVEDTINDKTTQAAARTAIQTKKAREQDASPLTKLRRKAKTQSKLIPRKVTMLSHLPTQENWSAIPYPK